ncbi:hypothetical protein ACFWNT_21280, partial [Streptomyces sp. NPDC058409]
MHRDERSGGISRARFLAGAGAIGAAAATGPFLAGTPSTTAVHHPRCLPVPQPTGSRSLLLCGHAYIKRTGHGRAHRLS